MPVRNRQHHGLDRRQPERKRASVVLDQDGDEPLEAAENRPVDDHRPVLGVVGADVLQVEPLRHLVVELDRGALPLPADGVGHVEVDLRPVEGAVALVQLVAPGRRASSAALSCASAESHVADLTEELGGPGRELRRVRQPEVGVDALNESEQPLDLLANLLLRHETVRIVLRELPDAGQAGQHARRFVAVQRRLLVQTERQIAIAPHLARRRRSMWPGQFIALTPISSTFAAISIRNMFWR